MSFSFDQDPIAPDERIKMKIMPGGIYSQLALEQKRHPKTPFDDDMSVLSFLTEHREDDGCSVVSSVSTFIPPVISQELIDEFVDELRECGFEFSPEYCVPVSVLNRLVKNRRLMNFCRAVFQRRCNDGPKRIISNNTNYWPIRSREMYACGLRCRISFPSLFENLLLPTIPDDETYVSHDRSPTPRGEAGPDSPGFDFETDSDEEP